MDGNTDLLTDLNLLAEKIIKKILGKEEEIWRTFFKYSEVDIQKKIESAFRSILKEHRINLNEQEYEENLNEVLCYLLGLGPLEKLLKDSEISEIMVNGPEEIFVERNGNLERSNIKFKDNSHLLYFIEKIISPLGRRVTEFTPYVDARLKDGSRVNIVRSPVSSIGPLLTIRKFSYRVFSLKDLVSLNTLNNLAADFLKACVIARLNILVSGGPSSGKTTLLNALGSLIPDKERVITIEDTRELRLSRQHTVPLETRPATIEGKGEITIRDLLKNSLHMRPDRIIIGEVRSEEVLDMIQAMNTGQQGSMTTLHANSSFESMSRLEVLMLSGNPNITCEIAKRQIISAVDLVIHMSRFPNGLRNVVQISEVEKSTEYLLEDIFVFDESDGQRALKFTGKAPSFYPRLKKIANYSCKVFEGNLG